MVNYYELGGDKKLHEIVFAGSHDAGITGGSKNVQTQDLDIFGQARAGVRIFDLRVAAAAVPTPKGQVKRVELKTFHSNAVKDEVKIRDIGGLGPRAVVRTKLKVGDWGIGLEGLLEQARAFIESTSGLSEFLILKFDKCRNWTLIAEACTFVLHNCIYKGGGNLNTKTLRDLKGKVIVVFGSEGVKEVAGLFGPKDGILGFKNLSGKDTYSSGYDGLQYYGKGGTNPFSPFKKKSQNVKKQGKLLQGAVALTNPEVMPMMYWTTTGLFESIKKRNNGMWDPPNILKMKALWKSGVEEIVEYRNPLTIPQGSPLVGPIRKKCMPNIVMIDFADPRKCRIIRELNDASPDDWAKLD